MTFCSQPGPRRSRPARVLPWLALAAALLLLFPANAFAYIDPGTGSLAYQMALAVLLGLGLVFRRTWQRAVVFVARLFRKGEGAPPPGPPPSSPDPGAR